MKKKNDDDEIVMNVYDKLRLDIIENMIEQRDIKCRKTKSEMIKYLLLDDDGKYVRETLYERFDKDTYSVGVDTRNHDDLVKLSKMVEKGDVRYMGLYQLNRIYFISNNKIEL
jgi:hypothetical protein